jgi:Gas vesicle synthesis protein GvpL/GvpF
MQTTLHLYAITGAKDAPKLRAEVAPCRVVTAARLAAVMGPTLGGLDEQEAALEHDRVVGAIVDVCSAVIPLRLGVEVAAEDDAVKILEENAVSLRKTLRRLHGRVEMGFKAIWSQEGGRPVRGVERAAPGTPPRELSRDDLPMLPFDLGRIHAIVESRKDRRELLQARRGRRIFEGSYLVPREEVDTFFQALDDISHADPELPFLASGPWAPYNFCDLELVLR